MNRSRLSLPCRLDPSGRARSATALICVAVAGVATTTLLAVTVADPRPAAGAPGTPGTPQAPKTLYTEDFENAPKTGSSQSLDAYSSTSPQAPGQKYTADPDWLNRGYCNGLLVSAGNTLAAGDCSVQNQGPAVFGTLKTITAAMGTINGTGAANTAVAAYTENTSPYANGQIEFATVDQLALPAATGRFLTFSVNAAAANCFRGATDPQLRFYFKSSNGTLTPVSTAAIDPCSGSRIGVDPAGFPIYGGQFPANGSLLAGSSVGIVMRNENGSGFGNDGAFDDIKVLDGTPQLDKTFSPASIVQGETSTLTFTITNTSDLAAKAGWNFEDRLPSDVTATGTNSTTCSAGVVTAAAGSTSLEATGNLTAGQASCTVSVEVTSDAVGTYTNTGCVGTDGATLPGCTTNVTTTGLDRPGASTLTVTPDPDLASSIDLDKTSAAVDSNDNGVIDEGDTINWAIEVSNTGKTPVTSVTVSDPTAGTVTCPKTTLAPDESMACDVPAHTITAEDVTRGKVTNEATATADSPGGSLEASDTATVTVHRTPTDDGTPSTSPSPSPAPSGSDAGDADTGGDDTGGDIGTGPTAATGAPRLPWEIGVGSAMILLGGLVLFAARRRRTG